ncbi:uncharacterized protein LOC119479395 isoform X2 [Sebastes umbrosus]|uniref:uncharacterized protein LOC119479395 isoform X2 n=1 Tax=Sebastes umbrosus TaxID=72105 RepID=UPI0018A07C78|nr:uncharacterized protein LOC119479395 isoform X2 [Sebastes umbrosus]
MRGMKHLLLLAVFVILARCQQKPQVSMSPTLKEIYSGDLFFLRCNNSASGSTVKWYFNDMEQTLTTETWKIGVATPKHSGSYQCESNGQKSDAFPIDVLDYAPIASLTIKTGQPVVRTEGSVVLQLDNEDGLKGWNCWFYQNGLTKMIKLRLAKDSVNVVFHSPKLTDPETIFWCSDTEKLRSNQIIVRISVKDISLEMYPLPAVVGESLTLKCLVWGTDQISRAVFYKDNKIILESPNPIYQIPNVTESAKGNYKCDATYTHKGSTAGPPYIRVSDVQDVFVQVPPMKAVLSANGGLSCSCPLCPGGSSYRWYHKTDGQLWALMDSRQGFMMPKASGTYACRAVWNTRRSLLSNGYVYQPPITSILIGGAVVPMILALAVAVGFYVCYRKRNTTAPIYEDIPLRSRDKGDDQYEKLQKGAQRGGEYDTLQPEAPGRQKKDGEYEALKKDEMTGGEYHTVRLAGAVGGEGGYEALKKEGMTGGEYHTVRIEGAVGGEGGYEALKKEGMTGGEYHTVKIEGAVRGEGGYEALKKEGMKEGVYHSLGMPGAGGGE